MRVILIVLAAAALAALPGAAAMGPQEFEAPDVHFSVDGQEVRMDTSEHVSQAPALVVDVETERVDVAINGPDCTVDPSLKSALKAKPASCGDAQVKAPTDVDIVQADVGLRFGSLEAVPVDDGSGAAGEATGVAAPVQARTVALAAAAAGASLAALYGAWRVLKWGGLAALIPLYSHITDDEILDDENRASIYRLIQEEAGISTKDIADRLGLAWGTVTHHLHKLEKRRFVVSKKYGKYRRYFANGAGGTEMKDQVAVLRLDRTGDVAALIQRNPGMTQKAVSTTLGVSSSTILWHVKRLEQAHLIRKERDGKLVRYYPGEGLQGALVTAPAPVAPAANAA